MAHWQRETAAYEATFGGENPWAFICVTDCGARRSGLVIKMPSAPSGTDYSTSMPNETVCKHFIKTYLHHHSCLFRNQETFLKASTSYPGGAIRFLTTHSIILTVQQWPGAAFTSCHPVHFTFTRSNHMNYLNYLLNRRETHQ